MDSVEMPCPRRFGYWDAGVRGAVDQNGPEAEFGVVGKSTEVNGYESRLGRLVTLARSSGSRPIPRPRRRLECQCASVRLSVSRPGASAGWFARSISRVDLGAEEKGDVGEPQPHEQDDGCRETSRR